MYQFWIQKPPYSVGGQECKAVMARSITFQPIHPANSSRSASFPPEVSGATQRAIRAMLVQFNLHCNSVISTRSHIIDIIHR